MPSQDSQTNPRTLNNFAPSALHEAEVLMNGEHILTPRMVSSLLNVSVLLDNEHVHTREVISESSPIRETILMVISAIAIALVSGVVLLYMHELGPFDTSTATATLSDT